MPNFNSACLHFLIMSTGPYLYFTSDLYPSNQLKYFDILSDYTTGEHGVSHTRIKTPQIRILNLLLICNAVTILIN